MNPQAILMLVIGVILLVAGVFSFTQIADAPEGPKQAWKGLGMSLTMMGVIAVLAVIFG